MVKGVFVILDGIGDLPHRLLENKTPLEYAKTPNLDSMASKGELGLMNSVREGYTPGSDQAILSIFGNDPSLSSRGEIEAYGVDIELIKGDLALRVNFASIDNIENGNILDRRAGRVLLESEAKEFEKVINKIDFPIKFIFKHTVGHRGVLVFRGGFSDSISGNDMTYESGTGIESSRIQRCRQTDEDENSRYTCNVVNEFLDRVYSVLKDHNVNMKRMKKGLLPANYLLIRGPGVEKPKLKQYKKWAALGYMPLEKGFSKLSGMDVYSFEYPKLKSIDVYQNLHEGLKKACDNAISCVKKKKNFDYIYLHIKETDLPGHDNKPFEKVKMIEYIDKTLFKFLYNFSKSSEIKIVVSGDHSTPCKLKAHSSDPIPVLYYNSKRDIDSKKRFNESYCVNGSLGRFDGKDLFKIVGFK